MRSKAEAYKMVHDLRTIELHCIAQKKIAAQQKDIATEYLMENEMLGVRIAERTILWMLGEIDNLFDYGKVAEIKIEGTSENE